MESKAPELQDTAQGPQDEETSCQPMPLQLNKNITVPMNKKKKNRKSTKARGPVALPKNRGTGFEGRFPMGVVEESKLTSTEYFADPPMTPSEALEEKDEIYNP